MAAGLGFKTFTTGEVLTAADTNGYLMQGVLVFASSAARAAAITSPQEGQYSYLKDTNSTEYYDGAAWIAAPIGDITGVTAGTGISGGGTSGTVTITNSMATEIAAKGDLIVGTGAATFDNLTVGANGTTLVADSTASTGLKWATPASGGGMTLINTGGTALTGASVTIGSIPETYRNLQLVIVNPQPATDTEYLYIRINGDSTANRYGHFDTTGSGSFGANYILGTNSMDNSVAQGLSITNFYDYANTTTWKMADVLVVNNDPTTSTNWQALRRCGIYNQTGAITSLVFTISSGNLNGGTAYLYGVK
jgi:hypothetical protein